LQDDKRVAPLPQPSRKPPKVPDRTILRSGATKTVFRFEVRFSGQGCFGRKDWND